jgi:predicted DNA-binding transcriptional regulator AlpA
MEYNYRCNYCYYFSRGGERLLMNDDQLLTSAEAAEQIGVSQKTLWMYRDQELIATVPEQKGRRTFYRYKQSEITAFLQRRTEQPSERQEHQ